MLDILKRATPQTRAPKGPGPGGGVGTGSVALGDTGMLPSLVYVGGEASGVSSGSALEEASIPWEPPRIARNFARCQRGGALGARSARTYWCHGHRLGALNDGFLANISFKPVFGMLQLGGPASQPEFTISRDTLELGRARRKSKAPSPRGVALWADGFFNALASAPKMARTCVSDLFWAYIRASPRFAGRFEAEATGFSGVDHQVLMTHVAWRRLFSVDGPQAVMPMRCGRREHCLA